MKINTKLLFSIVLILSSLCYGQKIHSFMSLMGSLADVEKGKFDSTEAGFSIALPKNPHGFDGQRGMQYPWRLNEGFYYVGVETKEKDIENSENFADETDKIFTAFFADIANDLFATKPITVSVDKKPFTYQTHKGIQARIVLPETICLIRVLLIENRAYKMAALLTEQQKQFEPQAIKVFDSLHIYSKENADSIIQKKIEENTPKSLPQTPVTPKAKSDTEDENLKGKVKFVLKESKTIKGNKAGSVKLKDSEDYYNELGNYVKRVSFDTNGLPFQIRVYGYLDGNRVEKTGSIFYESNPPLRALGVAETLKSRDSRYSMKFVHQYDDNKKLKEVAVYTNDNNLWTRTVYKYKDNQVERVTYQDGGKISTKSIEVLDSKGNTIESTYFGFYSKDWEEKSVYSYDSFDQYGNWTKRTQRFFRLIRGVEKEEWVDEQFRTITYY